MWKLSYLISRWNKRERNGTYETLSYKITCFRKLRCHSLSIKIPLMQNSQRPTCPALFTLESRRKPGHDLRGCAQCREWQQRQSGALFTVLGQLLPVRGAKRKLLERVLDKGYQPDQAAPSWPRWGQAPVGSTPTSPSRTTRHASRQFATQGPCWCDRSWVIQMAL